jgi:alpha-beta hydrolase superfamily lysophospholipase
MRPLIKHVLLFAGYGALGVVVTLLSVYVWVLQQRPELEPWHLAAFDSEFTVGKGTDVTTLDDYLALEGALSRELDAEVFARTPERAQSRFIRFASGSLADPRGRTPDWNRTVERRHPNARGAVLLLHGLSDSPYSVRALAQVFYDQGFSTLALRLPGHGTAPSALLTTDHRDWMAAVRLAMRHLDTHRQDGQRLYIAGYSMGAALAVEYAASRLKGERLPPVSGLVLLSPAIGVSPLAGLAVWQARLAALPGLHKLAWTDIQPEYDPYKYNSFTVNAGDQIYRLTRRIASELDGLAAPGGVRGMPPILAFQSVADATVSAPAVLQALFLRLAPEGHELVAFDINRAADVAALLARPIAEVRERLESAPAMPVDLTLVVNADEETDEVVAVRRAAGSTVKGTDALALRWPAQVYSLSHVALPFRPDDSVYGAAAPVDRNVIFLGKVALYGERGLLSVSAASLMRLRYNPFFPYLERRVVEFLDEHESADD